MASGSIEIPVLRRHVEIGMLYNIFKDNFLSGVLLWDEAAINANTHVEKKTATTSEFSSSDSLSEKARLLDVSTSLKASFLAGLVEVGGSASYLNNRVSSAKQCRITMRYKEETEYKYVHFDELGEVAHPQVFEERNATHVVIGVTYGAKAFMVFDQMASGEQEKQDMQGQLDVMVKKIPKMEISGSGKVNLTDEEKKKVEKFSCTYFGDIKLDENPTTYEKAVLVCNNLPKLMREKGLKGVPLRVKLYPLEKLDNRAAKLVREIRAGLVSDVEDMIEELNEARVRANDLIDQCKLIKVNLIEVKLTKFLDQLDDYIVPLKKNLGRVLPAIRAGALNEQDLLSILNFHEESSFSRIKMDKWLDEKETEIRVLRTHIDPLRINPAVTIAPPGPDLDTFIFNPRIEWLYVLNFTSLMYEEPYLSTLSDCLSMAQFKKMEDISVAHHHSAVKEARPWYKDPKVRERIREPMNKFEYYLGSYKHVISYMADSEYPGVCCYLYNYGKLYSRV